mgnify:CR=1 FL=1
MKANDKVVAVTAVDRSRKIYRWANQGPQVDVAAWGVASTVARDKGAKTLRGMLALAKQRLDEGRPLVIFPEGTRVAHGTQPPLQAGFAGLYKLLKLPVVPIAVDSGATYHHVIKRRGRITYKVGETIPAGLRREEVEARVHAAINVLNGQG